MKIINTEMQDALDQGKVVKLNLGAGESKITGFYNVDAVEMPGIDAVVDLNEKLDKFPDNSVSAVYTRHTLEHVDNFLLLMEELLRVCCSGAELHIIVPHFSNPYYYSDPTHVRQFGLFTMHYFMDKENQKVRVVPDFYTKTRFILEEVRFGFYRTSLLDRLFVPFFRSLVNLNMHTQSFYERRLCWIFPAHEIKYILSVP